MFAVLRQRNFAVLWIGQVVSLVGDWVLFVALPFYIYSLTHSTLATGIMFIVQTIPRLCFGSLAGVFVDRWNRKYTMLATDIIQFFVLLLLLFVHSAGEIWVIYIFAFVENTVSQFFIPAKSAIIPQLVTEKDLLAANSLNSTSQELTRLIGPFIGGLLLGLFGLDSVVLIDCCSFLFSASMIALIVLPPPAVSVMADEPRAGGIKLGKVWQEWLDGLRLVGKERLVTAIFLVFGVAMIGEGIIEVIIAGYVSQVLHGTALALGWLMSCQAVGGIIGSLLVVKASKRLPITLLIPLCGLIFGSVLVIMALIPNLAVILPLIALGGLTAIGFFVSQTTLLQSHVRNAYQGRIFGALNAVQGIVLLLGMGLASGLGDRLGLVTMVLIDAACNIIAALLALWLIRAALRSRSVSDVTLPDTLALEEAVS
jgi:MFS family permease